MSWYAPTAGGPADNIDIVADLRPQHVQPLLSALGSAYYVDGGAVREAVAQGGTFNAIHLTTAVKVDVFVAGADPFDAERVAHGRRARVLQDPPRDIWIDTPEHTVLRKLEWFRRGGEASERQWRDVIGVLRAQGERLDPGRMSSWAARLGVSDLLDRALREAGG